MSSKIKKGYVVEFKQRFKVLEIIEDYAVIAIDLNHGSKKDPTNRLILTVPSKFLEEMCGAWGNY